MSSSAEVDVGNPRRPFSEQSAKLLYRSLKDVEAGMNYEEHTMDSWRQIPLRSMEERLSAGVVKELLVQRKRIWRWLRGG